MSDQIHIEFGYRVICFRINEPSTFVPVNWSAARSQHPGLKRLSRQWSKAWFYQSFGFRRCIGEWFVRIWCFLLQIFFGERIFLAFWGGNRQKPCWALRGEKYRQRSEGYGWSYLQQLARPDGSCTSWRCQHRPKWNRIDRHWGRIDRISGHMQSHTSLNCHFIRQVKPPRTKRVEMRPFGCSVLLHLCWVYPDYRLYLSPHLAQPASSSPPIPPPPHPALSSDSLPCWLITQIHFQWLQPHPAPGYSPSPPRDFAPTPLASWNGRDLAHVLKCSRFEFLVMTWKP